AVEAGRFGPRPLYVVAEKILAGRERMPETWAIDGTTGYDFLVGSTGLFVDRNAASRFNALYEHFVGEKKDFPEIVYQRKKLIMRSSMAAGINMLGMRLTRIGQTNRR